MTPKFVSVVKVAYSTLFCREHNCSRWQSSNNRLPALFYKLLDAFIAIIFKHTSNLNATTVNDLSALHDVDLVRLDVIQ